jgi:hypothetical protein
MRVAYLISGLLAAATSAIAQPGQAAAAPPASYRAYFNRHWPAGLAVTPAEVRAMIAARGARATVQALAAPDEGPNRWERVVRGIASGAPAWLALAEPLSAGTDAGTTDDYVIAMSDAVITNATATLRLFQAWGGSSVETFCMDNGFETPAVELRAFYRAAIASVAAVTAPELQRVKAACLTHLRANAARTHAAG